MLKDIRMPSLADKLYGLVEKGKLSAKKKSKGRVVKKAKK